MSCWSVYRSVKGIECHTGLYMGVFWELNVILVYGSVMKIKCHTGLYMYMGVLWEFNIILVCLYECYGN